MNNYESAKDMFDKLCLGQEEYINKPKIIAHLEGLLDELEFLEKYGPLHNKGASNC